MAQPAKLGGPTGYSLPEIPRYVTYTSPVSQGWQTPRATTLPLNLLALIIAQLDDVGDIARVTRTCRLLYYMTLPQLYQRVSLRSYAEMRRVNGRPAGFGSGSPFLMAINGLVTKAHAPLVQDFRVHGQWKEYGVDDFMEGRVPDNTMMLNILLRAATDKMARLRSFAWELDCKPLQTVYQGLPAHSTLTTLSIKFPSSRMPRPSVMIPPIPSLRVFKAYEIDPLCYCDDISMLLLHSKKLEDVRFHFSPRMREQAEPSMNLLTFFGRCLKADYKLPVKHFAMQNFFGTYTDGLHNLFDVKTCHSLTYLDTFRQTSSSRHIFGDLSWQDPPPHLDPKCRRIRCNEVRPEYVPLISRCTGMERFYFVAPISNGQAPNTPGTPGSETSTVGREFMFALIRNHGSTMKDLLMSPDWLLNDDDVGELVRCCPNLEQLGLSLSLSSDRAVLRLLMPFLSKLKVLRVLNSDWAERELRGWTHEKRMAKLGADLVKAVTKPIKFISVGDIHYRIGGLYEATDPDGTQEMRREILMVDRKEVQHLEIFYLDNHDIDADPVLPFSP